MPDLKILDRQTLAEKRSRLEQIRFEKTENGVTHTQEREVFFRPHAVAILLYDPERKTVILTRQFRLPVYLDKKHPLLEPCAGLLKEGELPEHAVAREVEEETGYRISEIEKIAEGYSSPASFSEYVYFFLGKYSPDMKIGDGGGLEEEGENIEVLEFSGDEIRKKLKAGELKDLKVLVLVQHALLNNLI